MKKKRVIFIVVILFVVILPSIFVVISDYKNKINDTSPVESSHTFDINKHMKEKEENENKVIKVVDEYTKINQKDDGIYVEYGAILKNSGFKSLEIETIDLIYTGHRGQRFKVIEEKQMAPNIINSEEIAFISKEVKVDINEKGFFNKVETVVNYKETNNISKNVNILDTYVETLGKNLFVNLEMGNYTTETFDNIWVYIAFFDKEKKLMKINKEKIYYTLLPGETEKIAFAVDKKEVEGYGGLKVIATSNEEEIDLDYKESLTLEVTSERIIDGNVVYIAGVLKNNGRENVRILNLEIVFKDKAGLSLKEKLLVKTFPEIIEPQGEAYFFLKEEINDEVRNLYYKFNLSPIISFSDKKVYNLAYKVKEYEIKDGGYKIKGFIRNENDVSLEKINFSVGFFGENGKFLGATYDIMYDKELEKNQSTSFNIKGILDFVGEHEKVHSIRLIPYGQKN